MNKIAELPERTAFRVSGADAESFLHNVVTADINGLESGAATYAALLTPQGKVLFDFIILKIPDAYVVDCARAQEAALMQRLTMYKLRSDVTLETLAGASIYASWGGEAPAVDGAYADPRTAELGWRIIGRAETNATASEYHAQRIGLGIADSDADIGSAEVFPHEANLDQLGGVSFQKGCYVGQEVVSRMEHRGTARTRFVVASSGDDLTSGADIHVGDLRIGSMKSVDGSRGLALIRLDRAGDAIAKGTEITSDGHVLSLTVPSWARFTIPVPEEA